MITHEPMYRAAPGDAVSGDDAAVTDRRITDRRGSARGPAPVNTFWHAGVVTPACRERTLGHGPATVWLTGLSGAGKSTIAYALEKALVENGRACYVLDGDNLRHHLNRDLGFSKEDRKENIRRTAEVAWLMNEAGLIVISAFISPYREDRAMAAAIVGADNFVEVHVSTRVAVCEARDPKGLYARARGGQIAEFTGISAPYEEPLCPALTLDTGELTLELATSVLLSHLARRARGNA